MAGRFCARGSSRKVLAAIAAIPLYAVPIGADASPWPRTNGELFVITRADYFTANLSSGDETANIQDKFERLDTNTYIEYGLTDSITIGGKVVYGTSWISRPTGMQSAAGFSEAQIFGQVGVFQTPSHVGSLRASVVRPSRFSAGARAELASSAYDLELAALYGRNIITGSTKVFSAADVGFRKRLGDAADQIRANITIGVEPSARWLFLAEVHSEFSLKNESADGADFDVTRLQPSIVWRFHEHWSLQAGLSEEIVGRNIDLGRTFFLGIWSRF